MMQQKISNYLDWLLPSGTFRGPTAEEDFRHARCLLVVMYIGYFGLFISTFLALVNSGKVEVLETGYKVDKIEAPSVAVCPFNANSTIDVPKWGTQVTVSKYGADGEEPVRVQPTKCTYDRTCVCVDLSQVELRDHRHWATQYKGTTGIKSDSRVKFRERIEIVMGLTDSSVDSTFKIGLYDSVDLAPMWFYMHVGGYVLGQLELQVWQVSDFTWNALQEVWNGDWDAVYRPRHMWRYTSQEIFTAAGSDVLRAQERSQPLLMRVRRQHEENTKVSRISYEMKHFFVGETISSESAFSVYTLGILFTIFIMRSTVIEACVNALFPVWVDPGEGPKLCELSPGVRFLQRLSSICCCAIVRQSSQG